MGNRDVTSQFTRSTQVDGNRCTIKLTRTNYIGNDDRGKTIKTVSVTRGGNVSI